MCVALRCEVRRCHLHVGWLQGLTAGVCGSDVFGFGQDWDCWKVLVIEYRYGGGGLKTWISASEQDENYSCVLSASEGGRNTGDGKIAFSKEMLERGEWGGVVEVKCLRAC